MNLIGKMYVKSCSNNLHVDISSFSSIIWSRIFLKLALFFTLQELGAWKTRRRKQSEDAFQRVAEVKALEDCETGEPRKL